MVPFLIVAAGTRCGTRSLHKGVSDQEEKDSGSGRATRSSNKCLSNQEEKDSGKSKCNYIILAFLYFLFALSVESPIPLRRMYMCVCLNKNS